MATMKWLATNYVLGIVVSSIVVVVLYITTGICIMLTSRKGGIDVCSSAMIPIYNLTLVIRCIVRKVKSKKIFKENDVIEL